MNKSSTVQFPIPLLINREGKWFVAECPLLNVATQGRTEKEVRENMRALLHEYLNDADTPADGCLFGNFLKLGCAGREI